MFKVGESARESITLAVKVNGKNLDMEQLSFKAVCLSKYINSILQGIEGGACYIDDVLVSAKTQDEHIKCLEIVFQRLQQHGVRVGKEKRQFLSPSVEFLGYHPCS